jgi:RNA polymerase sigma-70 factor (ECF subfamily)
LSDLDVHLSEIAAGDAEAFGSWLAGAEPRVRLSLGRFAGAVDVEAVVQETMLRVWQLAPRHEPDGEPNSLLRLAVRIARNLAIDELRRRRPESVEEDELDRLVEGEAEPARPPDPLLHEAITACLERLKGRPRAALLARLGAAGESDSTLAAGLGMAVNTFLQNVVRARRALVDCLAGRGVRLEEHLR